MKKTIIIIFLFQFSFLFAQSNSKDSLNTFRNFKWNSKPEEIRENEESRFMQAFSGFGIHALSFRSEFAGLSARIDFTFKDSLLTEGSYLITSDNSFREDMQKVREHLVGLFGKPSFWAIKRFDAKQPWIKETDLGSFRGPELYWKFDNGFVSMQTSKYQEEVTITVIFVHNQTIEEYGDADIFTTEY